MQKNITCKKWNHIFLNVKKKFKSLLKHQKETERNRKNAQAVNQIDVVMYNVFHRFRQNKFASVGLILSL